MHRYDMIPLCRIFVVIGPAPRDTLHGSHSISEKKGERPIPLQWMLSVQRLLVFLTVLFGTTFPRAHAQDRPKKDNTQVCVVIV